MIYLTNLNKHLDDYLHFDKKLAVDKIDPIMANGLMVRGKEELKKIGFGVSASLSLFELAKKEKCDGIIVHHTFNPPFYNRFDALFQNRMEYLLQNKISLFGFHFLLDGHPDIGNNVEILKAIGARPTKPYLHRGNPWGWIGEFDQSQDFQILVNKFKQYISKRSTIYNFGPEKIKRIAAVSGKGAPYLIDMQELIDQKIDLFITGEVHEWNREAFKESDINFIAGGHYATEKFGVQALMANVQEKFKDVEVVWLELLNEI